MAKEAQKTHFRPFGLFALTFGCSLSGESAITFTRRLTVDKTANSGPKKPYSVPELTVYGNATELTQTLATGAHPDGGRLPRNKGTRL